MATVEAPAWRLQADALIASGELKEAKTLLRKRRLKAKGAERETCVLLLRQIDAEKAWAKLTKSLEKKKYTRVPLMALARLERFRAKYQDVAPLKARATTAIDKVRETVYTMVDDFEKELPSGLKRVDEPEHVKHGDRAASFVTHRGGSAQVFLDSPQSDWTEFDALVLWIYAKKKGGRLTIDVTTGGSNYFEAWSNVDWTGWREIRIPLRGSKSRFARNGVANWENVSSLRLWKPSGTSLDIVVDDVRLERAR
jgi:hypothetical protein